MHIVAHTGAIEHRAARAHGDALADDDFVDLHHTIFKQVCLRAAQRIELAVLTNGHAVMLGDVCGVQIDTGSDLAAHQIHGQRQPWRAAQIAQKVRNGQTFIHIGCRLGEPDKRCPHGNRRLRVAPDSQPFEQGHDQESNQAKNDASHSQIQNHSAPAPFGCQRHGVQNNRITDGNDHGMGYGDACSLDQTTPQTPPWRWRKRQVLRVALRHLSCGQIDGRRAQPGIAIFHIGIARHCRHDANQHVFGNGGPIRNISTIANETAARNHRGLHRHPASIDMFVTQHHGIGHKAFVSQCQHVWHHTQSGGQLGLLAHLGPQQSVPGR